MIEAKLLLSPAVAERFRRLIQRLDFHGVCVSECWEAVAVAGMDAIEAGARVKLPKREEQKELL